MEGLLREAVHPAPEMARTTRMAAGPHGRGATTVSTPPRRAPRRRGPRTSMLPVVLMALAVGRAARADDRLRLTLDEATAMLRRQNPDVLSAALRVRAAEGDLRTARRYPNPTLGAGAGNFAIGQTNPPGLGAGQTVVAQVGVQQEILLWGKRSNRIAAATERTAAAEASRSDVDRVLLFELRSRFDDVLIATERLRLAEENLGRYRETVRVSQARARAGEISPAELDRIMLEQSSFEREVADARLERRDAVAALLPLVGADASDVDAVGTLDVPSIPTDRVTLVDDALGRRPDLIAAERQATAADRAFDLARAERWPNPTVGVQYGHSQFTVSGDLRNQIGASVSMPLPVFDRNQGDIQRAEAEAMIARHEVDKLRLAIPQEIRTAETTYTVARERVRRFEDAFLRQAADALHAAEVSWREGASSLLEFLEAERANIRTQRDYLDALRDAHVAAWDLTRAAALDQDTEQP